MHPFRGIFPAIKGKSGSVFDPALLFAIFIYWLLSLGIHTLIGSIDRRFAAARYRDQWDGH